MANAACRRQPLKLSADAVIAADEQNAPISRQLPLNMGQALDKLAMSLVVNEIGDYHAYQGVVIEAKRLSRLVPIGKHRGDLDAVIDQPHSGLGDALFDQLADHGA